MAASALVLATHGHDVVHRQGDSPPVLFHNALEQIGPAVVEQVAEAVVGFGEEGGLHDAGFIFKGEKLHGVAASGVDDFTRDEPAGKAHPLAPPVWQCLGPDRVEPAHGGLEKGHGVLPA